MAAHVLVLANETVAVAEGSAGGLVSAALLSVPGASSYYVGGAVVYTPAARTACVPALSGRIEHEGFDAFIELIERDWALAHESVVQIALHHVGDRARNERGAGRRQLFEPRGDVDAVA